MNLKEKLVVLRKQSRLTQMELSEKLIVSRQAISRWESGDAIPSIDNLICLSRLYNVSIDYLLTEGDENLTTSVKTEEITIEAPPNCDKIKRTRQFVAVIVAFALVLSAFILIAIEQKKQNQEITPIEQMQIDEEQPSSGSFSIDW